MTYNDFKTGLFIKYHLVYLKSKPYIKFNQYHGSMLAIFENAIIMKVDAEVMLESIRNRNMAEAFCLMAQGYLQWEVGEILGKSERTIRRYIEIAKEKLFDN